MDDWLGDPQPMAQDMSQTSIGMIGSESQPLQEQQGVDDKVFGNPWQVDAIITHSFGCS